ncbi:MAG TPA: SRPBCC family protein [Trebonia sp.]|nr:SRPBCC family protein [Trebonia sp.]
MTELTLEADISGPPETVFGLITDFGGQERWLSHSSSFRGTTLLSPGPVALGTRYRESDSFGTRNGTVTRFEPPARVTFHQPMTLRLHAGTIDVTVDYTLTPTAGSTHVRRVVTLGIPGPLRLVQPLLVRAFRTESARTLRALKAHADQPAQTA